MGEVGADGGQCDGEGAGVLGREWNEAKPDGAPDGAPDGSDALVEDATSERMMQVDGKGGVGSEAGASSCDTIGALGDACSMGMKERTREDIGTGDIGTGDIGTGDIGTGDDDQIESSLVSEFEAHNLGLGSSSQPDSEAYIEEGYDHLFTDAMKMQLRAQILVLGDLLKGITPSPDWLEEACLEPGIGAEFALPEPLDAPLDGPAESNLQRISSAFQNAEASMSPTSEPADPPTTTAAGRLSNPGEPSSSGKDFLFIDDGLAQELDVGPSGQLMITYDHPTIVMSNPNAAECSSQAIDPRVHDNDKHLDLAQASAQDALTTATSALAQSHMVWARLHSQNHSEEGIARDARIASVAATVAAAASVAKAAVEAARAIAEVSVDAFIQSGGYQAGDTSLAQLGSARSGQLQVAGLDQSLHNNTRENTSQHRADMVESVVQAAGKAAEAATQAGVVLAKANPLIQMSGLSEFWSRKRNEGDSEHEKNERGGMNEGNGMDAAIEVDGFDGGREGDSLNDMDAVNEVSELDGGNEEDAVEEMEDLQEKDTASQDILDVANRMGDVHGGDITNQDFAVEGNVATANRDEGGIAAVIEAEACVENGVGMVEASGDEDVGVNEDEVVPVNEVAEPNEQETNSGPRSRTSKRARGRGRSQGVSIRAKRSKNSVGASSAILAAQTPENVMLRGEEPGSPKNCRDANARSEERGADIMENATVSTSGKDIPATAPDGPSEENAPASAAAQSPENEMQRKDDVPESPKNVRGGNARGKKRGAKQMGRTPVSTSRKYVPPATPAQASGEDRPSAAAARTNENEMQKQDDVPQSPKNVRGGNARGKKRGAKQVGNTSLRTSGKDTPPTVPAPSGEDRPASAAARTLQDEMQRKDDVPGSPKKVGGRNARGKKRGAKQVEKTLVSTPGNDVPLAAPAQPSGEERPSSAAVQIPENEMQREDDVPDNPKNIRGGNVRGKKRGTKQMGKIPVSTSRKNVPPAVPAEASGDERPCPSATHIPEDEIQREVDVPESPKNVKGGNTRGKKRGAKQMEKTPVSTSGKDTAERSLREPESERNTRDGAEHTLGGSAVEVMTDEVGLRGGWFSGTVLRITPNEAFVELHDLLTDDGKANVREWFPLVEGFNPYRPRRHVRPVHPFSIFTEAGSRKRRRVALGSQTWHIGDHVDAFFQDAWWEGIVAELNDLDPSKATIYFPGENDTQVVKTWDLRPSFQWKDNKWMPWKNPVLVEDERPLKRHRTGGPIKSGTKGGPDDLIVQTSHGKSSKGRTEMPVGSSKIPISSRKKSPIKMLQESKISHKRSSRSKISFTRLKTSENEDASQKQEGLSTITRRNAQQKDVFSPGTSKKLDFTMDSIATASASKVEGARSKASVTKAKRRHWRKKVPS